MHAYGTIVCASGYKGGPTIALTISCQETCRFPPALATAPPRDEKFAFSGGN